MVASILSVYLLPIDYFVGDWFLMIRGDVLTSIFQCITLFGSWKIIVPAAVCISVFLYSQKLSLLGFAFWTTLISAEATTFVLKLLVARSRPFDGLVRENDFSFPSGHATIAVAFYGFVVFMLLQRTRSRWIKNVAIILTMLLVLLIGMSRLYLGVHYLSDVVVGYIVGSVGLAFGVCINLCAMNGNISTKK